MTPPPIQLRVLMSTDILGGVWSYALELARALRWRGVQVILATMGDSPSAGQHRAACAIPDLIVCESRWRLEWMDAPWHDVARAGRWLRMLERRFRPDVVHLNHYSHGHLNWAAPSVVVGHSCVLSWWQAVHGGSAPAEWRRYRQHVRRGLQGADQVIAPSQAMLAALQTHYGPLARASVVHNGRVPGEYGEGGVPPSAKQSLILGAGRLWDAAKNPQALTAIAPGLRWPVYLAGETRHPNGDDTRLAHVRPLGRLAPEAMVPWFRRAGIYVLPARYEPFGLSVLEAALAGCAPVIGDIPSLRELWDGAACFVPPDDPAALRTAINGLIDAPDRRHALAQRARARAQRYTAGAMAEDYLQIYGELLGSARQPAVPASAT